MAVLPPTWQGYLTKQAGSVVKNWKVRWFVLMDNELTYRDDRKVLNEMDNVP